MIRFINFIRCRNEIGHECMGIIFFAKAFRFLTKIMPFEMHLYFCKMENNSIDTLKEEWHALVNKLNRQFDADLDMEGILFLVGVQEFGQGWQKFERNQKMDLMHIATCRLLCDDGFYEFEKTDNDGWPHYRLIKPLPAMNLKEQDLFLRKKLIDYFNRQGL